jgi:two-component system sensor histidine kinase KdpD
VRTVRPGERGRGELDLDAVLARRSAVALVDDLAHANPPGARHAKRWQDVLALLEAGIGVYTTVNVHNVESLEDVVAQVTGFVSRETVPDAVLARADEIELVDVSPDEPRRRLFEGELYASEQTRAALRSFFQRGNLP